MSHDVTSVVFESVSHLLRLLVHLLVSGPQFEPQLGDAELQLSVALIDLNQLLLKLMDALLLLDYVFLLRLRLVLHLIQLEIQNELQLLQLLVLLLQAADGLVLSGGRSFRGLT